MYFDSHCHLNDEKLLSNVDEYMNRAKENGVDRFLVVGWDLKSSKIAVKLAHAYECVFAAVGIQPMEVERMNPSDLEEIAILLDDPRVIALGEIGLDYYWEKDQAKIEEQKSVFIEQIKLANKHKLPITIHARDAIEDTYKILDENRPLFGGIMHCYSGSVEMAQKFVNLGLLISLAGPVTFTNAKTPKEVAKNVPLNRLLIETDSPYLAPHPYRGHTNEPAYVVLVAEEIAKLKNISVEEVGITTSSNACELFHVKTL